ncbi:MAG: ATP-dependent helicase, partial [Candidatus Micrarchaeia archaeon]
VESNDEVILVIAGPGSGKTRVLAHKVAAVLRNGEPSESILLLTFTNKAAKNMIERVQKISKTDCSNIIGGTFHHVANLFIRQNAHLIGYKTNYSIIDETDCVSLIRKVLMENFSDDERKNLPSPQKLRDIFSYCRNSLSSFSDYLEANMKGYRKELLLINRAFAEYDKRKKEGMMMDFDDLLINFNRLLDDSGSGERIISIFKYIFIDEFQDTNRLQFEIVRKLHRKGNHLFVVGDDCQSIYSFRAAEVMNMLNFKNAFPNTRVFYLNENYRSSKSIVSLINGIIQNNKYRFEKKLLPAENSLDGITPKVVICNSANEEARVVAKHVKDLLNAGTPAEEIAVLYRSNFQSAHLEAELAKHGIKYIKLGGLRFFEQSHIKDVIAFLKLLDGMIDELAWERVLRMLDGVGERKAHQIFIALKNSAKPIQCLRELHDKKIEPLSNVLMHTESKDKLEDKVRVFLDEFYHDYIKYEYDDFKERLSDIDQLISILSGYDTLTSFLEDVMLDTNLTDLKDLHGKIIISTIHQAKGLEWDNVFVIGVCNGWFPSRHSMENEHKLEEERRLFYVACSRARNRLTIFVPLSGNVVWGGTCDLEISQFISELPNDLYDISYAKENRKRIGANFCDSTAPDNDFVSADQLL